MGTLGDGGSRLRSTPNSEDPNVSATDKAKNAAQEAKGKVKEVAGRTTNDEHLEAEGKTDQMKANLKQAGEKVKDAFKD